jgi:hypothetical protein
LTSIKTESQSSKRTLKVKLLINVETKSKETLIQIKVEESRLMRDLRDSSLIRKEIVLMEISSMIKMVNQFLRKMPRDNG